MQRLRTLSAPLKIVAYAAAAAAVFAVAVVMGVVAALTLSANEVQPEGAKPERAEEANPEQGGMPKDVAKKAASDGSSDAGGTCADDRAGRTAPVTIPLETITAQNDGTGSATTTIEDVSVAQLLLHAKTKKGEGVPPGIACADLAPLAETGGIRLATLFLAGAISVLGVAAGLFILQQRIGAEN